MWNKQDIYKRIQVDLFLFVAQAEIIYSYLGIVFLPDEIGWIDKCFCLSALCETGCLHIQLRLHTVLPNFGVYPNHP